jgi:ATP-dependent exoDNAse (exonuclease V) beta subunit
VNYRSLKKIIEFNNTVFNTKTIENLDSLKTVPKGALQNLKAIYANSAQEISQIKNKNKEGYVSVSFLDSDISEEDYKNEFLEVLKDVRKRYLDGDILILGRARQDLAAVANYLIEQEPSIPFVSESSLKLFSNSKVKQTVSFLSYLSTAVGDNFLHGLIATGFFNKYLSVKSTCILRKYLEFVNNNKEKAEKKQKDSFKLFLQTNYNEDYKKLIEPFENLKEVLTPYELTMKIVNFFSLKSDLNDEIYLDRLLELIFSIEKTCGYNLSDTVSKLFESAEEASLSMPENPGVIRLMTIHKAKGLQAKVVLIPFLSWKMTRGFSGIVEYPENSGKYLEINKQLKSYVPDLEKIADAHNLQEFIEHFNLLYVALTRAEEELHIFSKVKKRSFTIANVFNCLFRVFSENKGEKITKHYTFGVKVSDIKDRDKYLVVKKEERQLSVTGDDIRSKLQVEKQRETKGELLFERMARKRGNVVHLALSFITFVKDTGLLEKYSEQAVDKAVNSMGILDVENGFKQQCIQLVKNALTDLSEYFEVEKIDKCFNEKEFISKKGKFLRIDRLVLQGEKLMVIDYKSGKPEESHKLQVREYVKTVKQISNKFKVKGLIYYMESGEKVYV